MSGYEGEFVWFEFLMGFDGGEDELFVEVSILLKFFVDGELFLFEFEFESGGVGMWWLFVCFFFDWEDFWLDDNVCSILIDVIDCESKIFLIVGGFNWDYWFLRN